ncbi:MAG: hypothetical protein H6906_10060 [Hyphomicrobiales bacterium]|nr:hypothetical protein [Hyphomicrobiales bacterium]
MVAAAALAGASYLWRMVVPMGKEVTLGVDWLDFPTLAYLPQYLGFFALGAAAARRGWAGSVTGVLGWAGAGTAVLAWMFLFPPAISGKMFTLAFLDPPRFLGGGTWQSAAYTGWDSVTAVALALALVALFRRAFAGPSHMGRFLARQGYAVYVLHCPVIVFVAYELRAVDFPALAKLAVAAVITLPLCFTLAWLLRRIPGVARVL